MLVQVGPPASSETATPSRVLPVTEVKSSNTGQFPVWPGGATRIVLRRSIESALRTLVGVADHAAGSPCHQRHVQSVQHQLRGERGGHRPANDAAAEGVEHHREVEKACPG